MNTTPYTGRHRDTTPAGKRRAQMREDLAQVLGRETTPARRGTNQDTTR